MRRRKSSKRRIVLIALLVILVGVFGYSAYHIYDIEHGYAVGRNTYNRIAEAVVTPREGQMGSSPTTPKWTHDHSQAETEDFTKESETNGTETEHILDPRITIDVDFEKLQKTNSDVVGWLYCDGVINYPVVQGKDNNYYLHRLYDKTYNYDGVPFMDYKCSKDFSDDVSIIYGHNMKDGSMFQPLTYYAKDDYLNAHKEIQLLTPDQNYILHVLDYELVSDTDAIYYLTKNNLRGHVDESILEANRFVLLSTCSYDFYGARSALICLLEPVS